MEIESRRDKSGCDTRAETAADSGLYRFRKPECAIVQSTKGGYNAEAQGSATSNPRGSAVTLRDPPRRVRSCPKGPMPILGRASQFTQQSHSRTTAAHAEALGRLSNTTGPKMQPPKVNNFDLLRLLAALQVVFNHATSHLQIAYSGFGSILLAPIDFFPGVPVFFTISGFLISWSYERHIGDVRKFYRNRIARIFPALWVCTLITVLAFLAFHIIRPAQFFSVPIMLWLIGQVSVFQFYTPSVLRSFGVGTPNGSLWTIAVELQFYLIVPLLGYCVLKPIKDRVIYAWIAVLIASSILSYVFAHSLRAESMPSKLMGVFLLPYLYNFIFGVVVYKKWNRLKGMLCNRGGYWLTFYLLFSLLFSYYLHLYTPSYWPNIFGFIANLLLSLTTISLAYTFPSLSERLLRGNDFSYGIYIYHMLVVNILVQLGYTVDHLYLAVAFAGTLVLAMASWFFVERPALRWKSRQT
jgi:peptidoglycan/LPS O-acetylase OafA/YrhL